ncbi:hypothetical protein Tco_0916741, partial [Tanacetum coccineum]
MDVKTLRLDLKYILKLHLRLIDRRCEYTLLKLFHAILQRATSAESSSRLSISWSRTSGSLSMETMKDALVKTNFNLALLPGHNLVELKVKGAFLLVENLNPTPMLTSLTLEDVLVCDEDINVIINCFPDLQALNLI